MDLEKIKKEFLEKIEKVKSVEDVKSLKVEFLGKKSEINSLMKSISTLTLEEKKTIGVEINNLRNFLTDELEKIESIVLQKKVEEDLKREALDITLPVRVENTGYIHPIARVQQELREIMYSMGFSLTNGPEIEDDWNCFEGLNIPKHHPARQMQDTFYLKNDIENNNVLLLRTQTTTMEVREMTNNKPPFKFICTGKVFRSEMDATHCPMFHQMEGVYVDEGVSAQDLKDCLTTILKKFFNLNEVPLRFRPSYFPFTSPSIEIDIKCKKQEGKIVIGEGDDWMEVVGAGMLHPNVFRNVGVDTEKYTGFAFGFGIERLAMMKYGIRDMRNLYDGDIRFLKHYGFRLFE